MKRRIASALVIILQAQVAWAGDEALQVFERRILPILNSAKPSSCAECHLGGVDLKDYIRPSQSETFAALSAAGLIDQRQPRKSKLLEFIRRQPAKPCLVSQQVRDAELVAFTAWIEAAIADPQLTAVRSADVAIGPDLPLEVVRHMRTDRVLESFYDNVWSEVGRCAACHSPDTNAEQVEKHGEQVSWITPGDPQATLTHLLEHELIDLDEPSKSLLLAKPTMQVKHGGGIKMVVGDRSYSQFRRFIEDYAAINAGSYVRAEQLPEPSDEIGAVSEVWFKVTDLPTDWSGMLLQVDLHRADAQSASGWSTDRWATSDRQVSPQGLWQHSLTMTASRDSTRAAQVREQPQLPAGRYLARILVDRDKRLVREFPTILDDREFVGEVVVESQWPAGYGRMTSVSYKSVHNSPANVGR
jgi:cytochrome c553